jgi:hypothetical protein
MKLYRIPGMDWKIVWNIFLENCLDVYHNGCKSIPSKRNLNTQLKSVIGWILILPLFVYVLESGDGLTRQWLTESPDMSGWIIYSMVLCVPAIGDCPAIVC